MIKRRKTRTRNQRQSSTFSTVPTKSIVFLLGVLAVGLVVARLLTGIRITDTTALDLELGSAQQPMSERTETVKLEDVTLATPAAITPLKTALLAAASPEVVWRNLLEEWSAGSTSTSAGSTTMNPKIAMEVGMHRPFQCIQAARAGLEAHCFEPSPPSFAVVQGRVDRLTAEPDLQGRIHLYNQAAGAVSGETVPFSAGGSTGDHVGSIDMWTMKASEEDETQNSLITVETVRLDDVIQKLNQRVYIAKIDTQGYEPSVLEGLQESIRTHAIQFILMEYWPKGIDVLNNADLADPEQQCKVPVAMLQSLVAAGYQLYVLDVMAHPHAGNRWASSKPNRPFDSLEAHCRWFYQIERDYPIDGYAMGYWTDLLAVAPTAPFSHIATTPVGKILFSQSPL